ncbi:hypothetical protein SLEP1_g39954 [Rubroshorea leprosula]|uniref:Uncharacterized protein n=1 Tax=Rubroshorea leprosula TaxID=152421 RepID=A0AAV5L1Z2_9ROSI|nr:hypothetical protein SLEP1_g39954 [Rubroshorea leprosula]
MMMVTEKEGWWVSMSLASSTMETRWPLPCEGYKRIVSSISFSSMPSRIRPIDASISLTL